MPLKTRRSGRSYTSRAAKPDLSRVIYRHGTRLSGTEAFIQQSSNARTGGLDRVCIPKSSSLLRRTYPSITPFSCSAIITRCSAQATRASRIRERMLLSCSIVSAERAPCFRALRLDIDLPAAVLGPVDRVHGFTERALAWSDDSPWGVSR